MTLKTTSVTIVSGLKQSKSKIASLKVALNGHTNLYRQNLLH